MFKLSERLIQKGKRPNVLELISQVQLHLHRPNGRTCFFFKQSYHYPICMSFGVVFRVRYRGMTPRRVGKLSMRCRFKRKFHHDKTATMQERNPTSSQQKRIKTQEVEVVWLELCYACVGFSRAMLCISADYAVARCPSVRPSVYPFVTPSYVGIVSKRLNNHQTFAPCRTSRGYSDGDPVTGVPNAGAMKNRDFRPISLYLGNDTRQGHSFDGTPIGS